MTLALLQCAMSEENQNFCLACPQSYFWKPVFVIQNDLEHQFNFSVAKSSFPPPLQNIKQIISSTWLLTLP